MAAAQRAAGWWDALSNLLGGLALNGCAAAESFHAEACGYSGQGLALLRIRGTFSRIRRTAADVARDESDAFFVWRVQSAAIFQGGPRGASVDAALAPGDFVIGSADWTFEAAFEGEASLTALLLPRPVLSPHLVGGRIRRPVRLTPESPIASLLAASLEAADQQLPFLPQSLGSAVLRNLAGLVGLACGNAETEQAGDRESSRSLRLAAIKQYIDTNVADPELSPARVAAAFDISVRQLHALFQPTNTTFSQYVLRQRLLHCRSEIGAATGSNRSVTDIALGWGFSSMSTFYRAFTSEFNAVPTDIRAARVPERPRL